jgi:HEAT repeat protein
MQEILFALGQLRSEASLQPVGDLARDKRVVEQIRIQALDTLGHIGSPLAMPFLLECLRRKGFFGGGEQPPIRLAAARALLALDSREAINALQRLADAEPRGEEREAFRRLLEPPVQP